ncbi:MAG: endonuclease domain-containing protein [Cellulomonas sp.]|nr:endonuclease domain-containing protein [Cellulomonas sp.]
MRSGQWERLCFGAYLPAARAASGRERALARIVAVHQRLAGPHWFSHQSAALVWGLPVWRVPESTHLRQPGRPGSTRDRTVARHTGELDGQHLAEVGALPVTDLALTAVDCARSSGPLEALVVADAALRAGARREDMAALLEPLAGRSGVARARAVVAYADGGAESAPETATRFALLLAGLPAPATQVPVTTRLGVFWADLGLPQWRLLIEYDGRVKYLEPDSLVREKRRHDAIVEAGWTVLRLTKEDLRDPADIARRVRGLLPPDLPLTPRRELRP